jgi:PAS domain S-box-containing protein
MDSDSNTRTAGLLASLEHLRLVVDACPYAVAMFDREMRYVFASQRWLTDHQLALSREELLGKCHYAVFQEIPAHWREIYRRGLAGEVVREDWAAFARSDGTVHWLRWEVRPWRNDAGQVQGILVYSEDVGAARRGGKEPETVAPSDGANSQYIQQQAEQSLLASETRFRGTFENAAVGIAHVGPKGQWLRVNDKLCSIVGYTRDELLMRTFQDITHPDDLDADLAYVRQVLDGVIQNYSMEKRYICGDGRLVWINLTVSLMRTAAGKPDYFISIVEDISARKAVASALYESESRFRSLADNISQLAWMADETGARFWFNRRWLDYTGMTLSAVCDWQWACVHRTSERERVVSEYRKRCAQGLPWTDTHELMNANAEPRWFLTQVVPLRDHAGRLIRWLGTHTDITTEREAQRAYERARFFELSLDMVCIADAAGAFVHLSPAFSSTLGFTREQLLGRSTLDFVHEEDRTVTAQLLRDFASKAGTCEFTRRFRCHDGTFRWLQWRWAASPGGMNYAIARDVTADRERVESLLAAEQELRNNQASLSATLRERDLLLQEIHHRVKNNLQVISSLINIQARRLDARDARIALEECKTRVEAIALVHEQLYQSKDYRQIPFSKYVRILIQNITTLSALPERRVLIEVDTDPVSLPVDKAIPCGLILNELVTNALKHAYPADAAGEVRVSVRILDKQLLLSVADDGVGMSAPTGDAEGSLGMQLIETLVEQVRGTLVVTHARGMTFCVTCPLPPRSA